MTWPLVQLRHVARLTYGDSLAADARSSGDIHVFGSNGPIGEHDRPNTAGPVVIIGRKGSYGKVQYSEQPVFAIDTTYFIDESSTGAHLRWLYYALLTARLNELSTDVGVPGLNRDEAYSRRIPFPPLSAQREIADFLDAETGRIEAIRWRHQMTLSLLEERRAAVRSSGLDASPGWPLKTLLAGPLAYGVLVPEFVADGAGTRMLRINNLTTRGEVQLEDVAWISSDLSAQYSRTVVRAGDVVVSVVGSMGRAAVIGEESADANLNRPLARLQPRDNLPPRLLWHWTQTQQFMELARVATGGGTAQPTLNLGDLANFRVGLSRNPEEWPSVLDRIDASCRRIDKAEDAVRHQIALVDERRQALIEAAVSGQLAVTGQAA